MHRAGGFGGIGFQRELGLLTHEFERLHGYPGLNVQVLRVHKPQDGTALVRPFPRLQKPLYHNPRKGRFEHGPF